MPALVVIKALLDLLILSVIDKLRTLGWGEEIDKMMERGDYDRRLIENSLVKQSKPLTDRSMSSLETSLTQPCY